MNGIQQNAHQQIITAIESTVPAIIANVIKAETDPLNAQLADFKAALNKSQDDLNAAAIKAADMVQAKQDIIVGQQSTIAALQNELAAYKTNLAAANVALSNSQAELAALKAAQPQPAQ